MKLNGRQALVAGRAGAAALAFPKTVEMPTVFFGAHRVSRLIIGGNPVSGNSHWNDQLS
jgi:hypothetical protein